MPYCDKYESDSGRGDQTNEDVATNFELFAWEYAEVEKEHGLFVEGNGDFICDLSTIEPLDFKSVLLVKVLMN